MNKMENMKFIKVDNAEQGSEATFQLIKEELENGRLHTIGLATGNTMVPVYERWVNSDLDFSNVTTFNLDEYVGISADSPNSYAYFMHEHLFDKKPFKETFLLNGIAEDLEEECRRYEDLLEEHGLDLQLLGVGENGHIAFNEPGTSFDSVTHVAKLTDSTLSVNSQLFANDEKIPDTALSLGIGSILRAKKIVLLAFGERKRAALEKVLEGKVTAEWPITKLLHHEDVTIITDLEL
jgi:glucosamine-6-phosphate deaminase